MADSVHDKHRNRMRDRFCETNFEGFQPHEVVEMLLFYGVPRKNTNLIAHDLIERFGSLHGVLSAHPCELQEVPGVTYNAAVMLSMIRAACSYDIRDQLNGTVLDSYRKVCGYFREIYRYEDKELVRVAMLDEHLHVQQCPVVAEGHPSAAQFSVRKLTELIYRANCNVVVMAHNHPRGTAKISAEDIAVTRQLTEILSKSSVTLADHVVVGETRAVSMREAGVFMGLNIE